MKALGDMLERLRKFGSGARTPEERQHPSINRAVVGRLDNPDDGWPSRGPARANHPTKKTKNPRRRGS